MIFDEIETIYLYIDSQYSLEEINAGNEGLENEEFEAALKREMNDQAYFLFIFTKLEKRIQDLFNKLVTEKILGTIDPKDKNSWLLIKKNKRLELMDKVSYFTATGSKDYNLIYDYKKKRDKLAHGEIATKLDIYTTLGDMKRLYYALENF